VRRLSPLVLLALASCVSNETHAPSVERVAAPSLDVIKAEQQAATKAYVFCLMRNARDLDDRRSDPGSIATGVQSACAREFDANVDAHTRYLSIGLDGREKVAVVLRREGYAAATQFVLKHRNGTLVIPK